MKAALLVAATIIALALLGVSWWRLYVRRHAIGRLHESQDGGEPGETDAGALRASTALERREAWPAAVAILAATLSAVLGVPLALALALALLVYVIARLVEGWRVARARLRVERQLSLALDLMVAALRAGASLRVALDGAARETPDPLGAAMRVLGARLRLGETLSRAVAGLDRALPVEGMRLFAFTLAVHAEGGGSLAPVLASVARAVRDRIEMSARVHAQSAQARAAAGTIVIVTYALGVLLWRADAERVVGFLTSSAGTWLAGLAIVLQALGLIWISRLSRARI